MLEKWRRTPETYGAVAGFIAVPLLWWLQELLVGFVFRPGSSFPGLFYYFLWGTLPGTVLGAGVSKAAFAHRNGNRREEKRQLLLHGAVVFTSLLCLFGLWSWLAAQYFGVNRNIFVFGFPCPFWLYILLKPMLHNLPFEIAALMLFIGLLLRPRR